jgi:hypothetical protein
VAIQRQSLWPFGGSGALLAVPLIWLLLAGGLALSHHFVGWPNKEGGNTTLLTVVAVGLIPILLAVFEYVATSRAAMDIKGIKIDFSQREVTRLTIELPPNLVQVGMAPVDSAPLEITTLFDSFLSPTGFTSATLASSPIIRIDIGKGDEWWVSRLLVVTAAAVRTGLTGAIAFVGERLSPNSFLAWASPSEILKALMEDTTPRGPDNLTYRDVYQRALRISKLLAIFGDPSPAFPVGSWSIPQPLPVDVQNYLQNPNYSSLGDAALEQVLMDLISRHGVEAVPDKLTVHRMQELFAHSAIRTEAIDLAKDKERQIETFLNSYAPYVALVRDSRYEGLAERAAVERLVLQQLFRQTQQE